MRTLTTLLALFTLSVPSHAASPRACRLAAAPRDRQIHIVSPAHTITNQPHFVVTAFAVPVAVPVAPFASYWYGISDYQHAPPLRNSASHTSLSGSTRGRTAPMALSRETASEAETEERKTSIVTQHCTACHGRTSPKQGLSLVDPLSLSDHDRLRAIRAVLNGEMPPDTEPPLTDADRAALVRELLNDTPTTENQNDQ